MKRYEPLFEKYGREFKAFYNPKTREFITFPSNEMHVNKAKELWGKDNALKDGIYRIYVGEEITVESWTSPDGKFFKAVRDILKKEAGTNISGFMWEVVSTDKVYLFPDKSLFYSLNLGDAERIVSYN